MRIISISIFLLILCFSSKGQSSYVNKRNPAIAIHDRLEIKTGIESPIHSSIKEYSRKDLVDYVLKVKSTATNLSDKDHRDIQYILDDSNEFDDLTNSSKTEIPKSTNKKEYVDSLFYTYSESTETEDDRIQSNITTRKPVLKHFFKTPANFFEINTEAFLLKINPVVNVKFGKDLEDSEKIIFQNTRGIELRGLIDEKVYFYTNLYETQGNFNDFIEERIAKYQSIPGFGSYKDFSSTVSDKFSGYDFPNSQAYVGFHVSKHVAIELGHNSHFIGNGYNSLLLSNYANNYFYLKFSTKVWKFHYQNLFAELAPISSRANPGDFLLPKKYMAGHYLSFRPRKNIEIGLFETVMFSRENTFELQYLNPIILYRTVEFFLDSPDNVLIGLNGKWNLKNRFSIYGQLILDEFKLSELKDRTGWWANKYGAQFGLKYIDAFGLDHLDIQAEYNIVRPYTYGQSRELEDFPELSISNYSHYSQPLAHPLGANFKEFVLLANYPITQRLLIQGRFLLANYGSSPEDVNFGDDILVTSDLKPSLFNNTIGQGISTNVLQLGIDVSYEFFHNYNLDLHFLYRNKDSAENALDLQTTYFGGGIRANVSNLKIDY